MKPIIGSAPSIIQSAIDLGIFCRPVEPGWVGEGLRPTTESFELVEAAANHYCGLYTIKPGQILLDWQLLTLDILREEVEAEARIQSLLFGGQ